MSQQIKAKFNVSEITKYGNGGGTKVVLNAVIGGSDENKQWSKFTPSGKLEMHITNPDCEFEMGEYYLTFDKSE